MPKTRPVSSTGIRRPRAGRVFATPSPTVPREPSTVVTRTSQPIVSTASYGYLRLRREEYDDGTLRDWAKRIGEQSWDKAYVFFKHEDEGAGPRLAARFRELLP